MSDVKKETDIEDLERELLSEGIKTDSRISGVANMLRGCIKKIPVIAIPIVVTVVLFLSISAVMVHTMLPKEQQELEAGGNALEGFSYMTQTEAAYQTVESTTEGESSAAGAYYPTQSIQSAFPEDALVQLGSRVYKLPVKVSELEEGGVSLIQIGRKAPQEDVILSAMERSGYISVDGNKFMVTLKNSQECTYHDMYVLSVYVNESQTDTQGFYAFGGLSVGQLETLLPSDYADISINDFTAVNTYTYGNIIGLSGGNFVKITCKGNKITSIRVTNDSISNTP